MNKTISIIRIAILFVLGTFATFFIFGKEIEENLSSWTLHFIIDKALGIAACFAVARLYKRWSKVDPWIKAYNKMCDEVMDNPNPSQL